MPQQIKPEVNPPIEKTNRIWDFLVLWPIIYFFLFFTFIMYSISLSIAQVSKTCTMEEVPAVFMLIPLLFILHLATIVLFFVLLVYSIHRLYTRTNLDDSQKKTWVVLILMFNFFAIPILHFMHLRK